MEYNNFLFLGVGAAVSILGFFIKRMKEEIDVLKSRNARLEINQARNFEKIVHLEKLSEDRREDIKKLFEKSEGRK